MKKSVIFDLDQTLVDTSRAEALRKSRNWSGTYQQIPSFVVYEGINKVIQTLSEKAIDICIITTSPSSYAKKVLHHFKIPYQHLVGYHDVNNKKPHPESFYKALKMLSCDCDATISFGDRAIDIEASKAAGIVSVGCTWGTREVELLRSSHPDYLISSPLEILTVLNINT
jgi:phosphoglycolate phosphatase-like HAD superfamily hydrolase